MARRRSERRWLTRRILDIIHISQLREHGGSPGIRDEALIESALARPRNKAAYGKRHDLATLAAAYAFGRARSRGFIDGNKRVAFMAAYVFLGLNGHDLDAPEEEAVDVMERLASGHLSEVALTSWIRAHIQRLV